MSKARDIADLDFNSPDIDGGNIDGAVIGATTRANGDFLAISASSTLTVANTNGYGTIELGGSTGAFLDLKRPSSDDYDMRIVTDGGTGGRIDANGDIQINATNEAVFNEAGSSVDLRVESSTTQYAFMVDGGNSAVRIGQSTGANALNVNGDISVTEDDWIGYDVEAHYMPRSDNLGVTGNSAALLSLNDIVIGTRTNQAGSGNIYIGRDSTTVGGSGWFTNFLLGEEGNAVFNENGRSGGDFRVESNLADYMFFVDAGADKIGINTNNPGQMLTVNGGMLRVTGSMSDPNDSGGAHFWNQGSVGPTISGLSTMIRGGGTGSQVELAKFATNEIRFNEDGGDCDFRVESNTNTHALFVDGSSSKTMFNTNYSADGGVVTIRGTYGANNASDFRGNNALVLTGADPGTTAAGSGVNLAFVPVSNRGATAVISGENTSTNKEGGAQLRFSVGGGSFPTTQKDMLMLNYNNGVTFSENVGIGTTPTYPLHIYDPTPRIQLHDSSSGGTAYLNLDGVEATLRNNSTNGALKLVTNNPREEFVYINGTAFYSESFNLNNGVQYDFDIDVPSEGGFGNSFFIIAGYAHNNAGTYAAHTVKFVATRSTGLATIMTIGDQTSAGGGAWQISKADNTTLRLRKTAGTYVGSGSGFITVIFRNAIG